MYYSCVLCFYKTKKAKCQYKLVEINESDVLSTCKLWFKKSFDVEYNLFSKFTGQSSMNLPLICFGELFFCGNKCTPANIKHTRPFKSILYVQGSYDFIKLVSFMKRLQNLSQTKLFCRKSEGHLFVVNVCTRIGFILAIKPIRIIDHVYFPCMAEMVIKCHPTVNDRFI